MRIKLTDSDRDRMMDYVARHMPAMTPEMRDFSYQKWWRGGHGWDVLQEGGTGILRVLYWYHHAHRPGSSEWRLAVILRALYCVSMKEVQNAANA